MNAAKADWRIKMLFDGKCPLCSWEVAMLRKRNTRGLIAFEDIAQPEFSPEKYGLTMGQVVGAMHAIRPDGSVVRGIDVFAEVYDSVGWTWLARPIRWRLTRPLAQLGYRIFAAIRPKLSYFNPDDCTEACERAGPGTKAPLALLIGAITWFGGCAAPAPAPTIAKTAAPPIVGASEPASRPALPTTEATEMKSPFLIGEAKLPKGFPAPGPVNQVIIKQYPDCRAAVVHATAVDGGENQLFSSLFNHIKSNHIAMSAPVDMTWSEPENSDERPHDP